jgi:hypothetical protein
VAKLGPLHFKIAVCLEHWEAVNNASANDAARWRPTA